VRRVVDGGGNITGGHDYKPFGGTFGIGWGTNRQGYIGQENDIESRLADHGVRKYDYKTGRFMSVDPLWGEYLGLTPYHYAGNNPVMFLDPEGTHVQALDQQSKQDIFNTLPIKIREEIVFLENGLLDRKSINSIKSDDENFNVLKKLVNNETLVIVENTENITFYNIDKDGNYEFNSVPMDFGFSGFTATPTSYDDKFLSCFPYAIHVQINLIMEDRLRAQYIGHELYGHAYFYILGKNYEHVIKEGEDKNLELKEFIKDRENNSLENFDER
jgi:RHS repeat-associated protein